MSEKSRVKRKQRSVQPKKKKKSLFITVFLLLAALLALTVVLLVSKNQVRFEDKVAALQKKDGLFYRSFLFSEYDAGNQSGPYPVYDEKEARFYYKNAGASGALTDKLFEDAKFPTGFYLNSESDKKYIAAVKSGGKWGYIYFSTDESGKLVKEDGYYIDLKFDGAEPFYNGIAAVSVNGKYGFINTGGNYVIEPSYESAKYYNEGLIPVKTGGEWFYIDINQKRLLGPYEDAESFSEGYACVKKNGLWGLIDKKGNFIVDTQYDDIWSVLGGMYYVYENNAWVKKTLP